MLAHGAPANAMGGLFFGAAVTASFPVYNVAGWINPILPTMPVFADANGCARLRLPVPSAVPLGIMIAVQWGFLTSPQCPGTGVFSASEGLAITVQ